MLWMGCSLGEHLPAPLTSLCLCFFSAHVFHPSHLNPPGPFGLFHTSLDWGSLPCYLIPGNFLSWSPIIWIAILLIWYPFEERHGLGTLDSFQGKRLCSSWTKCTKFTPSGTWSFWWVDDENHCSKGWRQHPLCMSRNEENHGVLIEPWQIWLGLYWHNEKSGVVLQAPQSEIKLTGHFGLEDCLLALLLVS